MTKTVCECPDCHGEGVKIVFFGDGEREVDCKKCDGKGYLDEQEET